MQQTAVDAVDGPLLARWARAATDALRAAQQELDRLNVFPVPDGDTGSNLALTLAEAAEGAEAALDRTSDAGVVAAAIGRGALVGARGSSGVIVGQYVRTLAGALAAPAPGARATGGGRPDGARVADALGAASEAAYAAVGDPVEGTVLTVARAVAAGAADRAAGGPGAALAGGLDRGLTALRQTPTQLPALRGAGVHDAGGHGLLLVLQALHAAVTGEPRPPLVVGPPAHSSDLGTRDHAPGTPPGPDHAHDHPREPLSPDALRAHHGGEFEVMYVASTGGADAGPALRAGLAALGDSAAVVGGDGLWQAHVHTDDPVGALEVAAQVGAHAEQVRVRHLARQAGVHDDRPPALGLVVVTPAPALAADLARAGAVVVLAAGAPGPELGRAVADTGAHRVLVLGGDLPGDLPGRAAGGVRLVADLGPVEVVAGAATYATLDQTCADDVEQAVRAAVAAVRAAQVDGGDGPALDHTVRRLLADPAVMLTVLMDAGAPPDVADRVRSAAAPVRPEVEVVVLPTGVPGRTVWLGAE